MTASVLSGLRIARQLLRRELDVGEHPREEDNVQATIAWIGHQIAIDAKRHKPRGKYRGGMR